MEDFASHNKPGSLESVEKTVANWVQDSAHSAYEHVKSAVENPKVEMAVVGAAFLGAALLNREALAGAAERLLPNTAILTDVGGVESRGFISKLAEVTSRGPELTPPTGLRLGADGLPRQLPGLRQLKLDAPSLLQADMSADELHHLSRQLPVVDDLQWGKALPSKRSEAIWHLNMQRVAEHGNTSAETLSSIADNPAINMQTKKAIIAHPNLDDATFAKMVR